ncbi:MAG: hypothetical protein AAGE52_25630 [Myxococcota bacterium]
MADEIDPHAPTVFPVESPTDSAERSGTAPIGQMGAPPAHPHPSGAHPHPSGAHAHPSGAHPSGPHPSGPHPSGPHPSGAHPHPSGMHPHPSGAHPHPSGMHPHPSGSFAGGAPSIAMPAQRKRPWGLIVVLGLAAVASAALVFFILSGLSTPAPPEVASVPEPPVVAEETPLEEGRVRILAASVEGHLFVDAEDKGPIDAEMTFALPPGTHRIEARQGDRIIASTPVELEAGEIAVVTLGESQPVQIRHVRRPRRPASMQTSMQTVAVGVETPVAMAAVPTPTPMTPANVQPAPMAPIAATMTPTAMTQPATMTQAYPSPMVATNNNPQPGVYPTSVPMVAPMAPGPAMAGPAMAGPQVLPRAPSQQQMHARLRSLHQGAQRCVGNWHGSLETVVVFNPNGSVRSRIGRGPSGDQRRCVQALINRQAQIRFNGRRTQTRFTFRL